MLDPPSARFGKETLQQDLARSFAAPAVVGGSAHRSQRTVRKSRALDLAVLCF